MQSYNPNEARLNGLGSSLFARHYLGNHCLIFFSSRYLDVSVLGVGSPCGVICLQHTRLSHSEIYGYNARVQLSAAYRSLPRPSSPLRP